MKTISRIVDWLIFDILLSGHGEPDDVHTG